MSVAAEVQQESIQMERRNQMSFEDWRNELLAEPNLLEELDCDHYEVLHEILTDFIAIKNDPAFFGSKVSLLIEKLIDKKVNESMEEFNNEYAAFQTGY